MGAGHERTDQNMSLNMPPISPNGSAPHCEHLDGLVPVTPRSNGCPECQARGDMWTDLRVCLTCGWVACSDDSPNQHARAHYQETDHPLAAGVETGSSWRWCYVHQRFV
ncbi:UBP-type zinc finger domain-containing protein [Spirillospora sp. CA-255316]